MSKRDKQPPRIEAREVSIFGEVDESLMQDVGKDIFELPGYSDRRRQLELDRKAGKKWEPLPFRSQLVPIQKMTGTPDYTKVADHVRQGYKLVSPDDLERLCGQPLWDERGHPLSSYQKGPDGTVRLNEYAVMVCDSKQAAANLAKVERRNREQEVQGHQRTSLSKEGPLGWTVEEDTK